ncbi:SYF2 splicing factor [Colletotrichum eremochloae]|nr:SYF2 splicing factor [Colletotrichum eremochloae]
MPPSKKRKTNTGSAAAQDAVQTAEPKSVAPEETETTEPTISTTTTTAETDAAPAPSEPVDASSSSHTTSEDAAAKAKERMARFKALKARAKTSSDQNFKEATLESQRLASDPSQLTAIHRKQAIASQKLLKADVEDAGGDFERKRAWDWTIDESEKWDKHVRKKEAHRDNNAFQDYTAESNKVYKRQLRNIAPDMDKYEKDKMAAIERAAASGGLDIVETEDGELIAVDKDGSFYSTADSTTFAQNKPDKAAVDRLVADLRRAEENRLKKRKDRMAQNGDDGDVTYINEKNKQFNQKLARFYNKYTAEIRDSFERGTMI